MGLKKAESQVKIMLADTILALCRNTLSFQADICVEGIIGVTIDQEEIFLVNINQSYKNPDIPQQCESAKRHKRSLSPERSHGSESSSEETAESSDSDSGCSKPRKRKSRKKKNKGLKAGSECSDENYEMQQDYDLTADNSKDTSECLKSASLTVTIKQEVSDAQDDEDLVFVKEEVSDQQSPDPDFPNIAQTYFQQPMYTDFSPTQNSQHSPVFPPPSRSIMSSIHHVSSQPMSPVPGPSHAAMPSDGAMSVEEESVLDGSKHNLDTLLSCGECGKYFTSRHRLQCHMAQHRQGDLSLVEPLDSSPEPSQVKHFQCSVCLASFRYKQSLQRHVATHQRKDGESRAGKMQCHTCGRFVTKANLARHYDLHLNKKHACHVCSKVYSDRSHLLKHIKQHHAIS